MIYSRFYVPVNFLTAREVTVWIEKLPGEIKWHYAKPKPSKRTQRIDPTPVWHVTAEYAANSEDGSIKKGMPVCDGQLICVNEFRAEKGTVEINDACKAVARHVMAIGHDARGYPCWGKGEQRSEALRNFRKVAGSGVAPEQWYEVDVEAYVNDEGSLCQPKGRVAPEQLT